jgi:hypothetical protein
VSGEGRQGPPLGRYQDPHTREGMVGWWGPRTGCHLLPHPEVLSLKPVGRERQRCQDPFHTRLAPNRLAPSRD